MNNFARIFLIRRIVSNYYLLNSFRINAPVYSNNVLQRFVSTKEIQSINKSPSLITKLFEKVAFITSKSRLKVTGYILYESIADNLNYHDIIHQLDLPDTFYSWFVITELYIWMLMVRYMAEGDDGRHVRNKIVEALWTDVQHRSKKLGAANPSGVRLQISELSEQFNAALIAYDEGLQSDDVVLAGAFWRRLYQQGEVAPEHLDHLVKYVRRQIKLLDNMTKYELFEQRKIKWEPFVHN